MRRPAFRRGPSALGQRGRGLRQNYRPMAALLLQQPRPCRCPEPPLRTLLRTWLGVGAGGQRSSGGCFQKRGEGGWPALPDTPVTLLVTACHLQPRNCGTCQARGVGHRWAAPVARRIPRPPSPRVEQGGRPRAAPARPHGLHSGAGQHPGELLPPPPLPGPPGAPEAGAEDAAVGAAGEAPRPRARALGRGSGLLSPSLSSWFPHR